MSTPTYVPSESARFRCTIYCSVVRCNFLHEVGVSEWSVCCVNTVVSLRAVRLREELHRLLETYQQL